MPFHKKEIKYHYITEADRKRLQQAEQSDVAKARKFKAQLTLFKANFSQEILICVYGETKDQIKSEIEQHYRIFQEKDPLWKIKEVKLLKGEEEESS